MSPFAVIAMWRHQRRHTQRARRLAEDVAVPPLVSIVVTAFNEEPTIVESIRALLELDYEPREIVIVNDGSTDGTLWLLQRTFQLLPAPLAFAQPLSTEPVRGVYRSVSEPDLVVADKQNGGRGERGYQCRVGHPHIEYRCRHRNRNRLAEPRLVPFLEDPVTVAVGGNIGIANGCHIDHGRIADVTLPSSWLARFQVVEYMRSFLLIRLACASQNAVVLISGAFGLFRRDAVIAIGGYDRTAIGEDMDLTIRLQRHFRERREPARIAFDPNPLCWTQGLKTGDRCGRSVVDGGGDCCRRIGGIGG